MKLSNYLAIGLVILTVTSGFAQDGADTVKYWKKKLNFGININQASFSSNWNGGGVNSIGLNSVFSYKANYAKGKHSWDNEIGLLFGFVNNDGQGYRKTVDRIFLDTKYGHAISDKWDLFTSLNFLSQFAKGFKYENDVNGVEQEILISDFFAPAYITSAWGAEYHPVDYFKVRFAPFAPRVTIVRDNNGRFDEVSPVNPFGVEVGESARWEWLAFQLFAEFNKDIAENLNLSWRYVMYANYETLEFNKIDHRLEALLTAKVNKFINVSLGGIMVYDYDQFDEVQFSQLFTFGFAYTFQNYKEPEN
jgi:hypothetical protein